MPPQAHPACVWIRKHGYHQPAHDSMEKAWQSLLAKIRTSIAHIEQRILVKNNSATDEALRLTLRPLKRKLEFLTSMSLTEHHQVINQRDKA